VTKATSKSVVPAPAPRIPNAAWADLLTQPNPRLLGPKGFVQGLARAKPDAYREIQGLDSIWAAGIVRAIEGASPECAAAHIRQALEHVAAGPTNLHQETWLRMNQVALAFDFFHDEIPPAARQAMIYFLNSEIHMYRDDEGAVHNSTTAKILVYLRIAYATWGENPRARDFRDCALLWLWETLALPVIRQFGAGGGWTECGWYSRHALRDLVEAMELARRFEKDYDGFQMAPAFFYNRMAYEMLQPYPVRGERGNEIYAVEGDGAYGYGPSREAPRQMRNLLSQYWRGSPLARHMAAWRRPGTREDFRTWDFFWEEPPDKPLPHEGFPLAHAATGIGRVYARGDWTDQAAWLRFECGDFFVNHQHYETGNFEIFCRAPLATESGEYSSWGDDHALGYLIRTIAHNCMLVHMPGEKWIQMRDAWKDAPGNDGGQVNKWVWPKGNLPEWLAHREAFHRGDLVAYDNRPGHLFVAGDCTAAYAPEKLREWVRQIVLLRPGTFVIFDRVVSTRPEYAKTWLLHMMNEPEIDGAKATIVNGPGRLVSHTLLPERAEIRKVHGYTYGGKTYDPWLTPESPPAPKWRIEVLPPTPRTDDLFLHVMFTGEPEPVELVRRGKAVGARIGQAEVLFEGKVGGSVRVGRKKTPLKAGVRLNEYEK
jgi:hypothetical protein